MLQKIHCSCCGEVMSCCDHPLRFYDVAPGRITTCIMCGTSFQEVDPYPGGEFYLEGDRKTLFGLRRLVPS